MAEIGRGCDVNRDAARTQSPEHAGQRAPTDLDALPGERVSDSLEERARAWYAIHFEEIVDAILAAVRPHLRSDHSLAFIRSIIHGHLRGIVSGIFSPPIAPLFIRGIGLEMAEFCHGAPAALTDLRLVLSEAVVRNLPLDLATLVAPRFEALLTEIVWGYAVTGAEFEQDRHATPPLADPGMYRLDPAWYEAIVDQWPHAIAVFDASIGNLLAGNRRLEEMFGYTLAEFDAVPDEAVLGPESPDGDHDIAVELTAGRIPYFRRVGAFRHKAGHMVWFETTAWLVRDRDNVPVHIVYEYVPADASGQGEQHWQRADRRFRYLAQLSVDPTFIVGIDGAIKYASPATERGLGIDSEAIIGTPFQDLVVESHQSEIAAFRAQLVAAPRQTMRIETRLMRRDGQWRWFELSGANMLDVPDIEGFSLQARDVTDRKHIESLLAEQATRDSLTHLLNRRGILEQIERAIAHAEAEGQTLAILYADLDYFKDVNDRFGHQTGDVVLARIAQRIEESVEQDGIVGRMGGDEFLVLLEGTTREDALVVARRIVERVEEPVSVDDEAHRVSISIGIAISAPGRDTSDSLISAADTALYRAKASRDSVPVIARHGLEG